MQDLRLGACMQDLRLGVCIQDLRLGVYTGLKAWCVCRT